MGGFGVSAVHGCPDAGLLGYSEMASQVSSVSSLNVCRMCDHWDGACL